VQKSDAIFGKLEETKDQLSNAEASLSRSKSQQRTAEQERDDYRRRVDHLTSERDILQPRLKAAEASLRAANSDVGRYRSQYETAAAKQSVLGQKVKELESKVIVANTEREQQHNDWHSRYKSAYEKVGKLTEVRHVSLSPLAVLPLTLYYFRRPRPAWSTSFVQERRKWCVLSLLLLRAPLNATAGRS
jgi:chromosome segregation ATPase